MTVIKAAVCLLLMIVPHLHALEKQSRLALVLGNDNYPGNTLRNARHDAESVAQELEALGYKTTLALDTDHVTLINVIDDFSRSVRPGDLAFIYYAGHGLQVRGENYLVPTDFHITDEAQVELQGYALSTLLEKLTAKGATTEIVVLDACRDNPFLGTRSLSNGWAGSIVSAGSFLAFGTAPGSTASDDPAGVHGRFTQSLLKYLPSDLDIGSMFQKVREDVIRESYGTQVPWISSSLIGSLHIDPKGDENAPALVSFAVNPALPSGLPVDSNRSVAFGSVTRSDDDYQETNSLNRAISETRSGRLEAAVFILRSILAVNPICRIALDLLGGLLELTGRSAEARDTLDRAVKLYPNDASAFSYRCLNALADLGKDQDGDCQRSLLLDPNLSQAHLGLAIALSKQGQKWPAYQEVLRALALSPHSLAARGIRRQLDQKNSERGDAWKPNFSANTCCEPR